MLKFHTPQRSVSVPVAITSIATGTVTPLLREDHHAANLNKGSPSMSVSVDPVVLGKRVHVIILVHGWIGCPQDLGYLQHAMEEQGAKVLSEQGLESDEPLYVYTCTSNHGKTNDGIQAGADRIARESQDYLARIADQYDEGELTEITLSLVGYSLGGLYSRYALPKILQSTVKPRITPKVFCTIATPHLGSKGHTYLQLPRLEQWLSLMTKTGRDLFHHTQVINTTITDPRWVEPLLRFEKRIAYANTYAMDVMVPTSTAAFVTENSNSEHFHLEQPQQSEQQKRKRFMALVVETPAQHKLLREQSLQQSSSSWDHATRLDAMGWTKVFVDFAASYRHQNHNNNNDDEEEEDNCGPSQQASSRSTCSSSSSSERRRKRRSLRSSQLYEEFQRSKRKLFLPVGHDLVAVNSKNVFYSYAMRRGRPLIDQLAHDFVRDIVLGPQQQQQQQQHKSTVVDDDPLTCGEDEV